MVLENFNDAYEYCKRTCDWNPNMDLLRNRVKQTYLILEQTAANQNLIQYGELAAQVGTDKRRYMSCILDAIGYLENEAGRPPLSVLVVNKENMTDGVPSSGFQELLENLGIRHRYPATTTEELFQEVRDEVWEFFENSQSC